MPGITPPELHLLENTDHVDGFREIDVGGKTPGVITPRKDLKGPSEFLEQLFGIHRTRYRLIATVEQGRMARLKSTM